MVSGMPEIHATEVVPQRNGAALMRCHGCGARTMCESTDQAERIAQAHRKKRFEDSAPRATAVLVGRRDTGEMRQDVFTAPNPAADPAVQALKVAEARRQDPHWWGWSWGILLGNATPEVLLPPEVTDGAPEIVSGVPEIEG